MGTVSRIASLAQTLLGLVALLLPGLSAGQAPAPAATAAAIAQSYLYVEPYQARVEVLFDAATVLHWQNAQTAPPATLTAEAQKALTESIAKPAADWCVLKADGQTLTGAFLGAAVIKGKPGNTLPFEAGAEIALGDAMVGLTWEFPTPSAPKELTLMWQGFAPFPAAAQLPVTVFFGTQSERLNLAAAQPAATWKSEGRIPTPPPLTEVPGVPRGPLLSRAWVYAGFAVILLGFVYLIVIRVKHLQLPGRTSGGLMAWVLASAVLVILTTGAKPAAAVATPEQAKAILSPLLRNVYRAFDHRVEEEIYDVLARSVSGDLLRTLYLETIQALTLDGREGTRVTINNFDAEVSAVRPAPRGFVADCQWTALGNVGHWGHTHTRVNRYTAQVTVTPEPEGAAGNPAWKITALQVTEARRL